MFCLIFDGVVSVSFFVSVVCVRWISVLVCCSGIFRVLSVSGFVNVSVFGLGK